MEVVIGIPPGMGRRTGIGPRGERTAIARLIFPQTRATRAGSNCVTRADACSAALRRGPPLNGTIPARRPARFAVRVRDMSSITSSH